MVIKILVIIILSMLTIWIAATIAVTTKYYLDHKKEMEDLDKFYKQEKARKALEEYIWAELLKDKQKEKENADKRKWQD